MNQRSQVPGCLKYGCVGCLSVMAIGVVLIFLVSALHLTSDPEDPRPEQRRAEHPLPAVSGRTPNAAADQPYIPEVLPLPELEEFPESGVGQVVLDLRMGEFVIRPGPADEPIRVEADFDASAFELEEEFTGSDGRWTYRVSFGSKRGLLGLIMHGNRHNVDNRVEIVVPRGHPIDLVAEVGLGELEADLGGLWIRRAELDFGAGDHFVEFRDPLPYPMETFRVESSVGSVEVRDLGDASPRSVEVDHGVGELFLDLKGAWRNDAEVDVDFGIGECRLWLPDDVHVDLKRASIGIGEKRVDRPRSKPVPDDAPTLTLEMRGNIGEVNIEY